LIQINPLVAAGMAGKQYCAGSCARGLERFPEKWTSGLPKKMRPRKESGARLGADRVNVSGTRSSA